MSASRWAAAAYWSFMLVGALFLYWPKPAPPPPEEALMPPIVVRMYYDPLPCLKRPLNRAACARLGCICSRTQP